MLCHEKLMYKVKFLCTILPRAKAEAGAGAGAAPLERLRFRPKKGGSGRLRLRNTGLNVDSKQSRWYVFNALLVYQKFMFF